MPTRLPCAVALSAWCLACEHKLEPGPDPRAALSALAPLPSAFAPRAGPSPAASAEAERALTEIRERALSLAAPPAGLRRIAFGRKFLVQAGAASVIVRESSDGRERFSLPVTAPRAAIALPAGSVLVPAGDASFRFDPGQRGAHRVTRLSLLPGAELRESRESVDHVWVVDRSLRSLLRYALVVDAGLGIESQRPLPDYDGGALTTLLDGSFLYSAKPALVRLLPRGKPRRLELPDDVRDVWRLLAGTRVDRAWAVTRGGDVLLLELAGRARVVRRLRTGLAPFDVAANARRLALVSVGQGALGFELHVYDAEGALVFRAPLPTPRPDAQADWVARVAGDKSVVIGDDPPRVAVGGPERLTLFDLETGAKLFGL